MQTNFEKYPSCAYGDIQKEEVEWQLLEKSLIREKWKRLFPDGITVFSGFDGMGVTRIALHNKGIPVKKYMASETDPHAVKLTSFNFPDVQHMGDITKIKPEDVGEVDLMVFGSPCQGFSNSGKKQGIEDERSGLLLPALELMKAVKPKYFLFENVRMKDEWLGLLDELIGVPHIKINSAKLTAQNRVRCYWTNIPNVNQPRDLGILLQDILEPNVTSEILYQEPYYKKNDKESGVLGFIGNKPAQATRVYSIDQKSKCLTALGGGQGGKTGLYEIGAWRGRKINPETGEREDDNPDLSYTQMLETRGDNKSNTLTTVDKDNVVLRVPEATQKGYTDIEDGDCFDFTFPNSKTRRGRNMKDKSNCLVAGSSQFLKYDHPTVRKLTIKESERLQGVEGWTEGDGSISNPQRARMLGNGFTCPIIEHILSFMDGTVAEHPEQLDIEL